LQNGNANLNDWSQVLVSLIVMWLFAVVLQGDGI
jgi:hypothetical protein